MERLPGLIGIPKLPEGLGEPVERGDGEGELHGTEPGLGGKLRDMGEVLLLAPDPPTVVLEKPNSATVKHRHVDQVRHQ